MVKITIEYEDGRKYECNDVLTYGYWDKDGIQYYAKDCFDTELTDDELKEFEWRCEKREQFPLSEDIHEIIRDVLDERNK